MLLVNPRDSEELVYRWLGANEVTLPSLFDDGKTLYRGYGGLPDSYAPYPVHVIIDQDGIIRYLSGQNDTERVRSEIQALLDAG